MTREAGHGRTLEKSDPAGAAGVKPCDREELGGPKKQLEQGDQEGD